MTQQFIPLRQNGHMWGEIDPDNWILRIKKQSKVAIFNLRDLLAEEVQDLIPKPGEELPDLEPGAGIEAVKRVAAASPFRENGHGK